tara:strand:+ start:266 stop:424 length:159 start_codon:yes stop_codon:yes gene_type:complete
MFSMIHVTFMTEGFLVGFTYYGLGDRSPEFADEDWKELNIYLFFLRISMRWF